MLELPSKKDIENISLEILKSNKALDVFPTPISNIVNYSDLVIADNIDLSSFKPSFFDKISSSVLQKFQKIRGFLDREEKTIYLDLNQPNQRKNFVKLHEVGHNVLPWQKEIMQCLDDDTSLDDTTKEEFEAEANYFASITLFQQDRFINELEKLPLSIESAKYLAKYFGSSIHAALRRYIESSKKHCALLVLENITPKGSPPNCNVKGFITSRKFNKSFGEIEWEHQLGYKWSFVQDYYFGKRFKTDGIISLITSDGEVIFNYHFFNNSYNAFVLFFPVGEIQKSKVTFIVTDSKVKN